MMQKILLIGPMAVGKSTVGKILAEQLSAPYIELDDLSWQYYEEKGFDQVAAKKLLDSGISFSTFISHVKPLEAYAVERFITDHPEGILDFGAGHVIHEDEALIQQVQQAFAPHPNVFLLIPSPDVDDSIKVLEKRILKRIKRLGEGYSWAIEENRRFIRYLSNSDLAKITIYTKDKTPDEIAAEIIPQL